MFKGLFKNLLRLLFDLLYHQFAWTYDWVADIVSLGHWMDWVMSTLPFIVGPRVLEIGYGPGHLQVAMRRVGFLPYGIDASWQMSLLTGLRVGSFGYELLLVNGYAQYSPFLSRSFNTVVATFPTQDIYSPGTLSEIYRVLIPGGKLVVLPHARIRGSHWSEKIAAWLFRTAGQTPNCSESYIQPFIAADFEVKVEIIEQNSTQIHLILATKPI